MHPSYIAKPINSSQNQYAFTLIELIITVLIVGVLASISVPWFLTTLQKWESKEVSQNIINSFRKAKSQSLIQGQNIILCPADINNICDKNASHSLLIFSDVDGNNKFDSDVNQIIFKQLLNLKYGHTYLRASGRNYIKFYGNNGLPRGHIGHIKYCPSTGNTSHMFQVSINTQGLHRYKPYSFKKTGCP